VKWDYARLDSRESPAKPTGVQCGHVYILRNACTVCIYRSDDGMMLTRRDFWPLLVSTAAIQQSCPNRMENWTAGLASGETTRERGSARIRNAEISPPPLWARGGTLSDCVSASWTDLLSSLFSLCEPKGIFHVGGWRRGRIRRQRSNCRIMQRRSFLVSATQIPSSSSSSSSSSSCILVAWLVAWLSRPSLDNSPLATAGLYK